MMYICSRTKITFQLRYFIELSYKGTNYHGWQVQPDSISIQELINKAFSTIFRKQIDVVGAGRTDTGVHAEQLFAHVDLNEIKNKYPEVDFGKNVFIGKNVQIGKNTFVGSNCIIESNVKIGKNCVIGSLVIIKYSIINDDVCIEDGSKIGTKGFGFIPIGQKNIRTPQIGKVILGEGVEIGANCTIDRGSVSDTTIGRNTFLDNHIQIAHNVKIGTNCMIAAQVGIAGSTTIGDNTVIGGQAGISGHLKIGNNVKIGGASGVTRDIPDNSQVMGYPAVPLRDFVKMRRKK